MPIKCLCALSEYMKMAIFADFAAPNECSGILAGYCIDDTVFIDNVLILRIGKRIHVKLKPQDYAKMAQLDRELRKQHKFIVGWFHSHFSGIFFSETDRITHHQWIKNYEEAIGIVLEASQMKKKIALGCFIYNKLVDDFQKIPVHLFRDSEKPLKNILQNILNSSNNYQNEIIAHFEANEKIFREIFLKALSKSPKVAKLRDSTSNSVYYVEDVSDIEKKIEILINARYKNTVRNSIKKIRPEEQGWQFWTKKEDQ